MRCFIGLGSNIGDRRENLERAASLIQTPDGIFRASRVYETAALVPEGASRDWRQPYLNAVAQIEWKNSPQALMDKLKKVEAELGRVEAPRWAPRVIDLDLLLFGNEIIQEDSLRIPHPGMMDRSFVLDPLKDLAPRLCPPGTSATPVVRARGLKSHSPCIMGIINVTPDSFSDGGETESLESFKEKVMRMEVLGVQAIDLGAESTRPGAKAVTFEEEWRRLEPALDFLQDRYRTKLIHPFISLDTRRPEIAERGLSRGVECINDVGSLAEPAMLELLKSHSCDYVLMHGLSVPADPLITLPANCDPVRELKKWLFTRLEEIEAKGIDLDRIIFDPGIGFGKTPQQSIAILQRMAEFGNLPVRLLVGHSRKSFMKHIGIHDPKGKDAATLALSLELARKGVDILRVHDFESHIAAFKTQSEFAQ